MDIKSLRTLILNQLEKENYKPIPPGILLKKILKTYPDLKKNTFYQTVSQLVADSSVRRLENNYLIYNYGDYEIDLSKKMVGVLSINSKGDGFVRVEEEEVDYYVNKKYLNGALKKDRVEFALLKKEPKRPGLYDAAITSVIEHSKDFYVGVVVFDGKTLSVSCDDPAFYLNIVLDKYPGLVTGHKILFHVYQRDLQNAYASVELVLGHQNDVGVDILSIVYDNNIKPEFHPEAEQIANKAVFELNEHQQKIRRFLNEREIISIDPAGSKDIDDAVFVQKLPKGVNGKQFYFLGVSIADVSYYVQPDTALDKNAFDRSTSVYLVDRVIPMLPHNLSNNICSLNPNVQRMAVTCDMIISDEGQVVFEDVYPSVITSKYQMSYDEVNDFFEEKSKLPEYVISVHQMLREAKELHEILRAKKSRDGYVNFDIKEPKIVLDKNNKIIEIQVKQQKTAQMMIEDFMVAANEAVTRFVDKQINYQENPKTINNSDDYLLTNIKTPLRFIYRTHDRPQIKKLEMFAIEAKKLGFKITEDFLSIDEKTISTWLDNNANHYNLTLVNKLLLRSMEKAAYSVNNIGHFGLASEHYTHFTSPIRRYSDLIVHRILWSFIFDPQAYTDQQRLELMSNLKNVCDQCNEKEVVAVRTERDVNSMKFAEYMSEHLNTEFEGVISSVNTFGCFVELDNTIEGLIAVKSLKNDFYNYVKENNTLVGEKTQTIITVGKRVIVKVIGANKVTRKIDFELVKFI
ncbi:ribonuclease R [Ureaplasma zalophigenitalium]|uniref:Ribonuclease R n=1 Tax=Ureaplasma zalophigenitalium TaxID=907723 RepID=A0ABT3BNH6_9BACT|nr:ribonuclease R [Ureaplasma zalophigenitalium]MCV3753787.1 ribonuclease R [Ureaplasma zalophigenitalium]